MIWKLFVKTLIWPQLSVSKCIGWAYVKTRFIRINFGNEVEMKWIVKVSQNKLNSKKVTINLAMKVRDNPIMHNEIGHLYNIYGFSYELYCANKKNRSY